MNHKLYLYIMGILYGAGTGSMYAIATANLMRSDVLMTIPTVLFATALCMTVQYIRATKAIQPESE